MTQKFNDDPKISIWLISPYHGGSHRSWAEGYQEYSRHDIHMITLPARFWKWRMHGGSVTLARRFLSEFRSELASGKPPDVILATDMIDLTTFLALTRSLTASIPIVLYMHENQLTYPLPDDRNTGPMRRQLGERDLHYAFINFASMLAADRVVFNSNYHRKSFFSELVKFLKQFPEYNELETIAILQKKSEILPVGIDFRRLDAAATAENHMEESPLILWNQRWEYDKNPTLFFEMLYRIAEDSLPFRLALCGQNFRRRPSEFDEAMRRLSDKIIFQGFADEYKYAQLLWEAKITISTADHEFFGISILEAIHCQTFPILPRGLSYPELIPAKFHQACLYSTEAGLLQRIRNALTNSAQIEEIALALAKSTYHFDWNFIAPQYDEYLENINRG